MPTPGVCALLAFELAPTMSGQTRDELLAEIDRLRAIVNQQKAKPEYRLIQRQLRNEKHRADFLQRLVDRLKAQQ